MEQAILCAVHAVSGQVESDCAHIHNALRLQTRGIRLFNRLWSKQENPPFNVARIHGSDELACETRKTDGWQWRGRTIDDWQLYDDEIDNWQLYDDDIDSWQSRGTEAYTVDASVAELGERRMYLEIWTTETDRRYSRSTDRERTCEGESIGTSGTYSATHQRAELHCMERYSEPLLRGNQNASGMRHELV